MSNFRARHKVRAILIIGLSLVLVAASSRIVYAYQVVASGFLKAQGRFIVDAQGAIVLLRGVDFFGYEFGLWDTHSRNDYQTIAGWGFNVVRLPIAWNFIEPKPGEYDESYFTKYVDKDISWAKQFGVYVILDMHQYGWSPHFTYYDSWHTAGVPQWGVSAYPNTAKGEAQAKADFWRGLGPNGTPVSATNPSMQDRFIQMWKYVASRYAAEPTIAAFDLFNEPDVSSSGASTGWITYYDYNKFALSDVPALQEKTVDGIRTVDTNHLILWEPALIWNKQTQYVNKPNVGYAPHYPKLSKLDIVIKQSEAWNQPVFIGEWGTPVENPNATKYIRDLLDAQDKYLLSWAWWTYGKDDFGMCLFDAKGRERTQLVQNLVRPFTSRFLIPPSVTFDVVKKEFRLALTGYNVVSVNLSSVYTKFTLSVISGSATWTSSDRVLIVSVPTGNSQIVMSVQ